MINIAFSVALVCVTSHILGQAHAQPDMANKTAPQTATPQLIGGKLLSGMFAQVAQCGKLLETPCGNFMLGGGSAGQASPDDGINKVPLEVVSVFASGTHNSLMVTSFDIKRQLLKLFDTSFDCQTMDKPVANMSHPEQNLNEDGSRKHGACWLGLKALSADSFSHTLKQQLEEQFVHDSQVTTLLEQVALADALSQRKAHKLSDPGGEVVLVVFGIIGLLVLAAAAGIYYLVYVKKVVQVPAFVPNFLFSNSQSGKRSSVMIGSDDSHDPKTRLLSMSKILPIPNFKQAPPQRSGADVESGGSGGGAAEELKNKLIRLREQRAKDLKAHD